VQLLFVAGQSTSELIEYASLSFISAKFNRNWVGFTDSFFVQLVSYMKLNGPTPPRLGPLVYRFLGAMHRYDAGRTLPILRAAKLTTPQLAVLEIAREPHTVSTVATYLGLSRPATSQLIDKLVRGRFVRRIEGTTDRRKRNIILRAKGKALLDSLAAARAARFDSSLAVLPPAAASRFQLILTEVVNALSAAGPPAPAGTARSPSRSRKR
jgi:DNA-binding MarR family transcriptional regulator